MKFIFFDNLIFIACLNSDHTAHSFYKKNWFLIIWIKKIKALQSTDLNRSTSPLMVTERG